MSIMNLMKTLTITAARKQFGAMLDSVIHEPILITRKNEKGAVVISAEVYDCMTGTNPDQRRVDSWKYRKSGSRAERGRM
jgi:prevent-host-death family protein